MNPTYTARNEPRMTYKKALFSSFAAVLCFLSATIPEGQAATAFQGSLKAVTITDSAGTNAPPAAVMQFTKAADGTYSFDASKSSDSDGSIVSYKWDFGDGSTATGVTASHLFAAAPTPTTLTVLDDKGAVAITQTIITEAFDIIIDNVDATFSSSGKWVSSTSTKGYYGAGYLAAAAATGTDIATWSFSLPVSGTYQLFCQYSAATNRASNAPYSIINNGVAIKQIAVDQRINGGTFFSLGTSILTKGTLNITLTSTTTGYVIADAVKAVYVP